MSTHESEQMVRDGQNDRDVDIEELVGGEAEPDHDLDISAFAEVDD